MRVILFVNPTSLVTNSLLSVCFSFVKTKNKNESFKNQKQESGWRSGNERKLSTGSRALLQKHAKFTSL